MVAAELVQLTLAALFLLMRLGAWLFGRRSADGPTYEEPTLKLDHHGDQPHEIFGELESTLVADRAADRRYLEDDVREHGLWRLWPVSLRTLLTAACIVAAVFIPYLHPRLAWLRLLTPAEESESDDVSAVAGGPLPSASVGAAKLPGATYDQQGRAKDLDAPAADGRGPIAQGGKTESAEPLDIKETKPPRPIDDRSNKALDRFFAKLERVERKEEGAVARILYFGDSIVASDFVTGRLRRLLQDRFGDAGHGYAIIANAWPGWFHIDVSRQASAEWLVSTCVGPYAEDGLYGLGCASFTSRHRGIWSEFGTATLDKWGQKVARFEIEYLVQPGGGALDVFVDGEKRERLDTDGKEARAAWHTVKVEDGAHKLKIESVDDDPVRVFGMRMERDVPGVTLSAMGITGARARFLDKQDDAHLAAVLRAAKPDLVCLAFGSNEITDGNMYPMEDYRKTLVQVMEQIERALPETSLMLVGPPDMASKKESQGHTRPMVHFIVKNQSELAADRGWAFWDQYRAMGGGGSMWAWIKAGLGSEDMFHPTGKGGNMLGTWQYQALMDAYQAYRSRKR
jgi:hypothetical protein